jgi:hypothetical protein
MIFAEPHYAMAELEDKMRFFSFFFILTPPTSSVHNFLNFFSNWAI